MTFSGDLTSLPRALASEVCKLTVYELGRTGDHGAIFQMRDLFQGRPSARGDGARWFLNQDSAPRRGPSLDPDTPTFKPLTVGVFLPRTPL